MAVFTRVNTKITLRCYHPLWLMDCLSDTLAWFRAINAMALGIRARRNHAQAIARNCHLWPRTIAEYNEPISWLMLIAIATTGMKIYLKKMPNVGAPAIVTIVSETLFLGCLMLAGISIPS